MTVVSNPGFFIDNAAMYIKYYGDRVNCMFPLKSYLDKGIITAIGSDTPVIEPDPMIGIYTAVKRADSDGTVAGACQQIGIMDAIRMYTYNGAYASLEEGIKGSIEPGKLADLVVLSDNILEAQPEEIMNIKTDITMIDGRINTKGYEMETKKEKKMKPWVIVRPRKAKEWVVFAMMILSLLSMISPVVNLFNIPCMLLGMPVLFYSVDNKSYRYCNRYQYRLQMGGALDASDVGTSCHNSVLHTCGLHTGLFGQRQAGYEQGRKLVVIGQHNGPYSYGISDRRGKCKRIYIFRRARAGHTPRALQLFMLWCTLAL